MNFISFLFWIFAHVVFIVQYFSYAHSLEHSKPIIQSQREVIVKAMDNVSFICEGNAPLNWTWPEVEDSSWFKTEILDSLQKHKSHKFVSKLFLQNVTFLHTGYFKCFYGDSSLFDESQADEVYLYVEDEEHLFASTEGVVTASIPRYSEEAVLPCRPTSPDVVVKLTTIIGDEVLTGVISEEGTIYTFDPHRGYITNDTQVLKQEIYKCTFTKNGQEESIMVILDVVALINALIYETNMGKDIEIDYPENVEFYCKASGFPKPRIIWTKDNKVIRPSERIRFTNNNQNLSILLTGPEDEGIYKCEAVNRGGRITIETNLKIKNIPTPTTWNRWLYLGVGGGGLVLVIVITLVLLTKCKSRKGTVKKPKAVDVSAL